MEQSAEVQLPAFRRRFIIFSHPYDERSGGLICLHKLCHLLNVLGQESFLTPYFSTYGLDQRSSFKPIARLVKSEAKSRRRAFATNPALDTPVIDRPWRGEIDEDTVVIYPEIVEGNPLGAQKVIRWLLYRPGVHTGKVHYGTGELYVPYSAPFGNIELPGSKTLTEELRVVHYPLDLYAPPNGNVRRHGAAHLVRKSKHNKRKKLEHHDADSIQIDQLSHREIAEIFRRVETFVSYDTYSAYSFFAALSGCDSVVIPDEGIEEESWYPNPRDRDGIAYGWDGLEHARSTRHRVLPRLQAQEANNILNVARFLARVDEYFFS